MLGGMLGNSLLMRVRQWRRGGTWEGTMDDTEEGGGLTVGVAVEAVGVLGSGGDGLHQPPVPVVVLLHRRRGRPGRGPAGPALGGGVILRQHKKPPRCGGKQSVGAGSLPSTLPSVFPPAGHNQVKRKQLGGEGCPQPSAKPHGPVLRLLLLRGHWDRAKGRRGAAEGPCGYAGTVGGKKGSGGLGLGGKGEFLIRLDLCIEALSQDGGIALERNSMTHQCSMEP